MANLLCTETHNLCFDDLDSDQTHETSNQNLGFENDRSEPWIGLPLLSEECFCLMVEKERGHLPRDDYFKRVRSGDMDFGVVRKEAMDWILKVGLISFIIWVYLFFQFFQLCNRPSVDF